MPAWMVHHHKMAAHPDEMRSRGQTIGGFDRKMLLVVGPGTLVLVPLLYYLLAYSNLPFIWILAISITAIVVLSVIATFGVRD